MVEEKVGRVKYILNKVGEIASRNKLYWDANFFSVSERRSVVDKTNVEISRDSDSGVKLRVWDGEKFLEYATTSLNENELITQMDILVKQALRNKHDIKDFKELDYDKTPLEKDFILENEESTPELEDITKRLQEVKKEILESSDSVIESRVVLIEEMENHIFTNSNRTLYQKIPVLLFANIAMIRCDDGQVRMVYTSYVDNSYLELFSKQKKDFVNFKSKIDKFRKARKLKGGKYKVVLAPKLTGLLAHESFGHGMEADTMMKDRALASNLVGEKIGLDYVNIVDYPGVLGKHGTFFFDHEGNLAQKTYLVKNGIINKPMADLYSKTRLGLESSSNARFESFDHKHYTRMSNTYFEQGDRNYEDLISDVEDGIFITDSGGGMEDPKGWGVQIQGNFGQRIKNGKLVDEYYDGFALTGFLPDIIKNIAGISKEFEIEGGGRCGKGHKEWVRVSEGGPYMLINEVILG